MIMPPRPTRISLLCAAAALCSLDVARSAEQTDPDDSQQRFLATAPVPEADTTTRGQQLLNVCSGVLQFFQPLGRLQPFRAGLVGLQPSGAAGPPLGCLPQTELGGPRKAGAAGSTGSSSEERGAFFKNAPRSRPSPQLRTPRILVSGVEEEDGSGPNGLLSYSQILSNFETLVGRKPRSEARSGLHHANREIERMRRTQQKLVDEEVLLKVLRAEVEVLNGDLCRMGSEQRGRFATLLGLRVKVSGRATAAQLCGMPLVAEEDAEEVGDAEEVRDAEDVELSLKEGGDGDGDVELPRTGGGVELPPRGEEADDAGSKRRRVGEEVVTDLVQAFSRMSPFPADVVLSHTKDALAAILFDTTLTQHLATLRTTPVEEDEQEFVLRLLPLHLKPDHPDSVDVGNDSSFLPLLLQLATGSSVLKNVLAPAYAQLFSWWEQPSAKGEAERKRIRAVLVPRTDKHRRFELTRQSLPALFQVETRKVHPSFETGLDAGALTKRVERLDKFQREGGNSIATFGGPGIVGPFWGWRKDRRSGAKGSGKVALADRLVEGRDRMVAYGLGLDLADEELEAAGGPARIKDLGREQLSRDLVLF